ncbi:MAG TPA: tetratricopeptide repeat protein [Saprospiraceae bacterium]|nr:tetratricopeptide repeat protein [Saprospiraceae bacterium]
MMFTADHITNLLANAYYRAAMSGAPMRTATETLEGLRVLLDGASSPYTVWRAMDRAQGQALEQPSLLDAVQEIRQGFIALLQDTLQERVRAAFAQDATSGGDTWLLTFAEALAEWRPDLYQSLAETDFPFDAAQSEWVTLIRQHVPLLLEERWTLCATLFRRLAALEQLPPAIRAKLWSTYGQIELYHFYNNQQALAAFEKAKALAPQLSRVARSFGEYYIKEFQYEEARKHLQQAIRLDPEDVESMLYMGETYAEEDKTSIAAEWLRDALRANPGEPNVYFWLIKLCGKPDFFIEHEADIPIWVQKAAQLDARSHYSICLTAGYAFQQNQRIAEAEAWYLRAVEAEPTRQAAYLNLGYMYRDLNQRAQAFSWFEKILHLQSDNFDAHWELAWLYHGQADWSAALQHFEQALPQRPEWRTYTLHAIGEMHEALGNYDAAVAPLLEALTLEPNNTTPLDVLHRIADQYKVDAPQRAIELLQAIRETIGVGYEADFQNRLGIIHYENGNWDQAIEHYQRAIETRPDDAVQQENIGLAYEAAGQFQEAEAAYQQAIALDPESPVGHNRLGIFYYNCQQHDQAIACYQQAIKLAPDNAIYHNNIALAEEQAGLLEVAEKSYQKAIQLDTQNAGYQNDLGVFYHNREQYEKAIVQYQQAIAIDDKVALYYNNLGYAQELLEQTEAAIETYTHAATLDGTNHNQIARIYLRNNQPEQAEAHARQALETNPGNAMAYDYLTQALAWQGKDAEAERVFKEAIAHSAQDQDIFYNNLGLFYYNRNALEQAIAHYQQAITLRDNYALYYDNIGLAYEAAAQTADAEAAYQRSIELEPQNALYINRLGTFYYRLGRYEAARQQYQAAVQQAPDDPIGWENLGLAAENLGYLEDATNAFEQALNVSHEDDKYLYFNRLGVFYYHRQQYKTAQLYYEQAIARQPDIAIYYENLGLVYEDTGDTQQAVEYFQQVATLEPDNARIHNRLGNLFYRSQRYDEAIPYYQKAATLEPTTAYIHENLGLACEAVGQAEAAEAAFRQALAVALPEEKAIYYNRLGIFFYNRYQNQNAIEAYRAAVALQPNYSIYYDNLGLAQEGAGQWAAALQAYEQAHLLEPQFPPYFYRMGNVLLQLQQYEAAVQRLQEAVQLEPTNSTYLHAFLTACQALPDTQQAVTRIKQLLDLQGIDKDNLQQALQNLGA